MKAQEIRKMKKEDLDKKLKELKLELVKARANAAKTGTSRAKEIKKIIARILTLNQPNKKELSKK